MLMAFQCAAIFVPVVFPQLLITFSYF